MLKSDKDSRYSLWSTAAAAALHKMYVLSIGTQAKILTIQDVGKTLIGVMHYKSTSWYYSSAKAQFTMFSDKIKTGHYGMEERIFTIDT